MIIAPFCLLKLPHVLIRHVEQGADAAPYAANGAPLGRRPFFTRSYGGRCAHHIDLNS